MRISKSFEQIRTTGLAGGSDYEETVKNEINQYRLCDLSRIKEKGNYSSFKIILAMLTTAP